MDDLSPLRPILVMLLFWFIMGVIRLDSNCMELLSTEDILPRGESCSRCRPRLKIFLRNNLDCASKCGKQCQREPGQWLCYQEYGLIYSHLQGGLFFVTEVSGFSHIILVEAGSRYITKILRMVHALEIVAGRFWCWCMRQRVCQIYYCECAEDCRRGVNNL